MKPKSLVSFCLPCVAFSMFVSSCGEKKTTDETEASSETPAEVLAEKSTEVESANPEMDKHVELIKEVQKEQKAVPVKEEEVRDVAGFAKHLPKDTEMFFNAQDVSGLISSMRGSEIGEMIAELSKKEGDDVDEVMKSAEFQEFLKVAGEEVFFSMGDGSAQSLKVMGDMYGIYYKLYYYMIGKFLVDAVEGGDLMQDPEKMQQVIQEMMKPVFEEFLKIDSYEMPRMYAGFKVSNAADRARYTQLIQDTFAKAMELNDQPTDIKLTFELDSTDVYGGFKGVKLDYGKLFESLKDAPSKELEMLGFTEEVMEQFTEKFKDFKLTILAGNYGDYVVIYLGDTSEGVKFLEDPSDSLLANGEMSFLKEYKSKEVVSISYVSKEIFEELEKVSTVMEDLAAGVNQFLKETESFGDTTHIQLLLEKMALTERNLASLTSSSRFGSVAYLEDGFKMDSFHGSESAMYDLDSQRKLANIAMREDALLSSSWVVNEENTELAIQNLENLVNLAYQITKLTVEHDIKDAEFLEFAEMFKMLDGQFSDELLTIWNAAREGMKEGLGNEGAMVVDMQGKMPRVPDVPTVVLENGKIPRVAIGYDVLDRSKLTHGWELINATNQLIVAKLERLTNEKINYRIPELSKKEGIDFWSYQLGITSHESNLAIGLNEQMMFFNTSPAFVESFVADYDADGKRGGMDMKLRFTPVRSAAQDWMKLVDEHGDELSPSFNREEFEESRMIINDVIKASEEVDSLDFSMRKVNGEVRSFLHLNKRN